MFFAYLINGKCGPRIGAREGVTHTDSLILNCSLVLSSLVMSLSVFLILLKLAGGAPGSCYQK